MKLLRFFITKCFLPILVLSPLIIVMGLISCSSKEMYVDNLEVFWVFMDSHYNYCFFRFPMDDLPKGTNFNDKIFAVFLIDNSKLVYKSVLNKEPGKLAADQYYLELNNCGPYIDKTTCRAYFRFRESFWKKGFIPQNSDSTVFIKAYFSPQKNGELTFKRYQIDRIIKGQPFMLK